MKAITNMARSRKVLLLSEKEKVIDLDKTKIIY